MRKVFEFPVAVPVYDLVALYSESAFFVETMKVAGARSVELLEDEPLGDGARRFKARIPEAFKLPEFLMTSDRMVIVNESVFHPKERRLEWRMTPSMRQSIVQFTGEIRIEEEGSRARLVYDVSLDIRIPFVGSKMESVGLQVVGRACAEQARFAEERALTSKKHDSNEAVSKDDGDAR